MPRLTGLVVLMAIVAATAADAQNSATSTIEGTISRSDATCNGSVCKEYPIRFRGDGTLDAVLTWTDDTTWLWLSLQQADGKPVAQSSQSRLAGLSQHINVPLRGGSYVLRVELISGSNPTPFSLTTTGPN